MLQTSRKPNFYIKARQVIRNILDPRKYFVYICNNLQVPNMFRIDDSQMKIWSFYVTPEGFRKLKHYFERRNEGQYQLHVITSGLIFADSSGKSIVAEKHSSWIIVADFWNWTFYSKENCSLVLVEYRKQIDITERPLYDESLLDSPNITFIPSLDDFRYKRSFIRGPLTKKEICQKILFIDGEYTLSCGNSGQKSPLSVAILNYQGDVLMNKKITPRGRVLNFGEKFHGISEEKSRNRDDEYDVIKRIQKLTSEKILIGHDLTAELQYLMIPKFKLYGIRDFANAQVFDNKSVPRKNNGQWFSLKMISKVICDTDIQDGLHTALEDAKAIRAIYLKVEDEWIDDIQIPLTPQKVYCKKISLSAYNVKRHSSVISISDDEPSAKYLRQQDAIESETLGVDIDQWDASPACEILLADDLISNKNSNVTNCDTNIPSCSGQLQNNILTAVELQDTLNETETPNKSSNIIGVVTHDNRVTKVDYVSVASETTGWDTNYDSFLKDSIMVKGETYMRSKATIEYINIAGKMKTRVFDFD